MPRLFLPGEAIIYLRSWACSSEVPGGNFPLAGFSPTPLLKKNYHFVVLKMTMQSVGCNRRKLNFFHVVCSSLKILQWLSISPKTDFLHTLPPSDLLYSSMQIIPLTQLHPVAMETPISYLRPGM